MNSGICQLPSTTSGKKKGRKLVRAISAESIYRCMLIYLDHILYRRAHFVRDALLCSLYRGHLKVNEFCRTIAVS